MQVFPPNGQLEFVEFDIFGLLTETMERNRFVLVRSDRISKLMSVILMPIEIAPLVERIVLEHRIISQEILNTIQKEKCLQFVSKVFAKICVSLDSKLVTTNE